MNIIKPCDMGLGDIVAPYHKEMWEYSTCTVKRIDDGYVTLFRPYVQTSELSYTGEVICYIGIEEYKIAVDSKNDYILFRKENVK